MKRASQDEYSMPALSSKKIRVCQGSCAETSKAIDLPKTKPVPIPLPRTSRTTKIKATHKVPKPPEGLCHGELSDRSPRCLIEPLPVKYEWQAQKKPLKEIVSGSSPSPNTEPRFWYPDRVEDTIKKTLFIHPSKREIVWVGRLAEAKLKNEIKNYHRIKELWLSRASDSFTPGCDKKHEVIAKVYEHEMLSPWVVCWLSQLIGEAEVDKILEYVELNLKKSLAELDWRGRD